MTARDEDNFSEPGPRRGRRDVLEVGRGERGNRRSHPRDLDDEAEDRDDDEGDQRRGTAGRGQRRGAGERDEGRYRGGRGERDEARDRYDDDDRRDSPRRGRGRDADDEPRSDRDRDDRNGGDRNGGDRDGKRRDDQPKAGASNGDPAKADKDDSEAQASAERRKKRRPIVIIIVAVVALLLVAGGIYYYLSHRGKVNTDDAYTDGNIVAIAPQVSGLVIALEVNDNQFVHKGDVLIRIDPRQFQYSQEQAKGVLDANKAQVSSQRLGVEIARKNFPAALQLAQANLQSAKANLALQESNNERQQRLPRQATTQQEVETTNANLLQAQAQVAQAQARLVQAEPVQQNIGQSQEQVSQLQGQAEQAQGQLDQANLNIEWATVRAPQDGWVTRRNVNAGNYVQSGTQIMSLVTTDVWVTANYKETELDGMRPGQKVTISVDAYPDLALQGHVDSIQRGSGSRFSAFPAENATGNFVKIVQRVPVKIVIDSGLKPDEPLPLGISVVPTVMLK